MEYLQYPQLKRDSSFLYIVLNLVINGIPSIQYQDDRVAVDN